MTLSTTQSLVQHTGNDVTTTFQVPFRTLKVQHLRVTQELAGVITNITGFTGANLDQDAGGTITLLAPPPTGALITIRRIVPSVQETDYVEGDPFPAETHEAALDYLTMLVQQLEQQVSQQISVPDAGLNLVLPPASVRASKHFAWDAQGLPIASTVPDENKAAIAAHDARRDNPHGVTAAQVGAWAKAEADARFINAAGDTMTGALSVPGPPTDGSHAVNKQTLDVAIGDFISQPQAMATFVELAGDTMTGGLTLPAGSAAAPALIIGSGPHSGLYAPADDIVGMVVGGTERVRLDRNGMSVETALNVQANNPAILLDKTQQSGEALLSWHNMGLARWTLSSKAVDGDSLAFRAYDDTGHFVVNALTLRRTGEVVLALPPSFPMNPATKQYVDDLVASAGGGPSGGITQGQADLRYVNLTGDTMTGELLLSGPPTVALGAATKDYVDGKIAALPPPGMSQADGDGRYVNVTGDAMQGPLSLVGAPTIDLHAATKGYVDTQVAAAAGITEAAADLRYVNTAGDTMTGALQVDLQAAGESLWLRDAGVSPTQPSIRFGANAWGINWTGSQIEVIGNGAVRAAWTTGSYVLNVPLQISHNNAGGNTINQAGAGTALDIQQTGTGKGLLITAAGASAGDPLTVEDSTRPDSTPFIVKNDGKVGIGLTAPTVALEVVGEINASGAIRTPAAQIGAGAGDGLFIGSHWTAGAREGANMLTVSPLQGSTFQLQVWNEPTASSWGWQLLANAAPAFQFLANVNINRGFDGATAQFVSPSDARMKENVEPTQVDALTAIGALRAVSFDWRPETKIAQALADRHVPLGFIAQEVQQVIPSAVQVLASSGAEGQPADTHMIDPNVLCLYLVRAVQQLAARVAQLEAQP